MLEYVLGPMLRYRDESLRERSLFMQLNDDKKKILKLILKFALGVIILLAIAIANNYFGGGFYISTRPG